MLHLVEYLGFLKRKHFDHDSVDDFNTRIVCWSALIVGFLLFASEYGTNSIQCYEKASWKDEWRRFWIYYANDLCFVEGTYFVDTKKNLPDYYDLSKQKKVTFYQWTPFLYLLFALMFHLPRMYWSGITSSSYMYFRALCNSALNYREEPHKTSVRLFKAESTRNPARMPSHFGLKAINHYYDEYIGKRYLIATYFVLKIWNILNAFVALVLLCILVGDNRQDPFGFSTLSNVLGGVDWKESGVFPRVTTCEIRTRHYGKGNIDNIKTEQIQCLLSVNNFIEKIFIVTWILFVGLLLANVISLIYWIRKIWTSKEYVVEKIIATLKVEKDTKEKREKLTEDASKYANLLLPDARFTVLMVEAQSGDRVGCKDLTYLFIQERPNLRPAAPPPAARASSAVDSDSD